METMTQILRKFNTGKDPVFTVNPFVENMVALQYKFGKIKSPTVKGMEIIIDGDLSELVAEPEDVLDFDAEQFPEHLELFIPFTKNRLDDLDIGFGIRRLENEMLYNIFVGAEEEANLTSPLNFMRIRHEMSIGSVKYGFFSDTFHNLDCVQFYFVRPAQGNMLNTFNEAWKDVENLYYKSRNGIVTDIKKNY